MAILAQLDRMVAVTVRWAAILALVVILVLIMLGVVARTFPVFSMSGYDEIIELLMAWVTFMVAAMLWREGTLFRADALEHYLPAVASRAMRTFVRLAMLAFAVVFTYYSFKFAANATESVAFFGITKKFWYFSLPASGLLMSVYAVAALFRSRSGADVLGAVDHAGTNIAPKPRQSDD